MRYFILGFILCCTLGTAQAQIHNRNQKFFEAGAGLLDGVKVFRTDNSGKWLKVSFGKYGKKEGVWQAGFLTQVKYYELPDARLIGVEQYLMEGTFTPKVIRSVDRKFYLSPTVGVVMGYESADDKEIDPSGGTNFSKWLVGFQGGLTGEWNVSHKTAIIGYARGNLLPSSRVQPFHFLYGIGVRINYFK